VENLARILQGPGDLPGQEEPQDPIKMIQMRIAERVTKLDHSKKKNIVIAEPEYCPVKYRSDCECCKDGNYMEVVYEPEFHVNVFNTRLCYQKVIGDKLLKKSRMIGRDFEETFQKATRDKHNRDLYAMLEKWEPSVGSYFIMAGKSEINPIGNGTGKSYLLHAIANKFCRMGIPCICNTFDGFFKEVQSGFENRSSEQILREYINVPALLLDEMGKEPFKTDWVPELIFRMIDLRGRMGKGFIIASNFDYDQIEGYYGLEMYGPSIVSRLNGLCGKPYILGGPDRRIQDEQANLF
jgi:DNA replication protein DnaC